MESFVINLDSDPDRPLAIGDRHAALAIAVERVAAVDRAVRSESWRTGGPVPSRAAAGCLQRPVRGAFTAATGRPA